MKNSIKLVVLAVFALFVCTSVSCVAGQAREYSFATSVKASHILVDSKEEATLLKSKIDNGESFEALAKSYSKCPSGQNGGDLGYFGRGQMVKEFDTVVFSGDVGTVLGPVQTQFGYHLIEVTKRTA